MSSYVGGPVNYSRSYGYENPELTETFQAGVEAEDQEERMQHYADARQMMIEDTTIVMISTRAQAYAYNEKVGNFVNFPGFLTFYSGYGLAEMAEIQN